MQTTSPRAFAGRALAQLGAASLALLILYGCGGGGPLLHPAQVLRPGRSRFSAGTSGNLALGQAEDALNDARAARVPAAADRPPPEYIRGALVAASIAPGMAPFVSARVGIGFGSEAGLAYTGRNARVDARHAFDFGSVALSLGAGAAAILGHRDGNISPQLDHLKLDGLSGWGADVPIIIGWRSNADVFWWWGGARAGIETLRGSVAYEMPPIAPGDAGATIEGNANGQRVWGSALTGAAIGFRHLHAGIEVQGTYHDARGTLWGTDVKAKGFSLTPSAALLGSF